jgi:hypothetical protein
VGHSASQDVLEVRKLLAPPGSNRVSPTYVSYAIPPPGVLKVTRINSGNISLPNPVKDWDQSIVNWSSSRECAMTVCTEYVNSYSRRCTYNEHNLDMNWFAPFSA